MDWDAIILDMSQSLTPFLVANASIVASAVPYDHEFSCKINLRTSSNCLRTNRCCIPRPRVRHDSWSRAWLDAYIERDTSLPSVFPPVNNGIFFVQRTQDAKNVLSRMMSVDTATKCDGCTFVKLLRHSNTAFFSETSFSTYWLYNQTKPFVRHFAGASHKNKLILNAHEALSQQQLRIGTRFIFLGDMYRGLYRDVHDGGVIKYCAQEYLLKTPSTREPTRIPRVVYQTHHRRPPTWVVQELRQYATPAKFSYAFFNDSEAALFLRQNYHKEVEARFWRLSGPHRADLFRYCILYAKGGYYFDVKTKFRRDLSTIFKKGVHWYTSLSIVPQTIYQGILVTSPFNPILKRVIDFCLQIDMNVLNSGTIAGYTSFTTKLYHEIVKMYGVPNAGHMQLRKSSGVPRMNEWALFLFDEKCTRHSIHKDRYGLDCSILDDRGKRMFTTRHYDFPWKI